MSAESDKIEPRETSEYPGSPPQLLESNIQYNLQIWSRTLDLSMFACLPNPLNPQHYADMDRQAAIFEIPWVYQKRPKFRFADIDHECLNISRSVSSNNPFRQVGLEITNGVWMSDRIKITGTRVRIFPSIR
ncbi:hypothetical protein B0H13DRAFT_1906183 [Mycena leptocephala]|nr:hypothetical protein B0H13DRAFT_1906183 [Mycena leptocephala]